MPWTLINKHYLGTSLLSAMETRRSPTLSNLVDFFSGSGTTAQAAMELNAKEQRNVKFICVQLPEILSKEKPKQRAAYELLSNLGKPHTLNQIGIERIIRAAKKIKEETGAGIDYGFKCYELCEPDKNALDKMEVFDQNTASK